MLQAARGRESSQAETPVSTQDARDQQRTAATADPEQTLLDESDLSEVILTLNSIAKSTYISSDELLMPTHIPH